MKPQLIVLCILCCLPFFSFSQIGLGLKAGLNFAKVTKASNIQTDNASGFHAGIFLSPKSKGVIGYRTELIFSRQGYDFKNGTTTGNVKLDYILLPQLLSINITKFVSIQVGAQMAYLLSATADSSKASTGNPQVDKMLDLFNRFDYGAAGGVEVHPYKGILIGARMNVSFSKLYKDMATTGARPNFYPSIDAKNNVIQIFAGYKF